MNLLNKSNFHTIEGQGDYQRTRVRSRKFPGRGPGGAGPRGHPGPLRYHGRMRRHPILLVALAVLLAASAAFAAPLRILHTNDLHSRLEPWVSTSGDTVGGFARLATLIDRESAGHPHVLVLDAGDLFQGTPYYNTFRGEAEVRVFGRIGYDVQTMGNHELDDGALNFLAQLEKNARWPVLSANILVPAFLKEQAAALARFGESRAARQAARGDSTLVPIGPPYVVQRVGPLQVGIIGVTTETLPKIVTKKAMDNVHVRPVLDTVRALVPEVRRQADLVVVLSHCGIGVDSVLATSVPGIDVIVGGHDHRALEAPLLIRQPDNRNGIGGTLLVQAGQWGEHLGRLDLDVEEGRIGRYEGRLLRVTADLPPAARVDDVVREFSTRLGPIVDQILTQNESPLPAEGALIGETALGNLVTDLMRETVRADIAVQNGGGLRGDLQAGPVRLRDLYTVLPFDNTIVTMRLSGRHVEALLEESLAKRGRGGFLHVSGLSFVATAEGRVRDIRVGEAPLDRDRVYRVATNNFTAAGGDGFRVFETAQGVSDTGVRLRDAVIAELKTRPSISARVEGRIRIVAE